MNLQNILEQLGNKKYTIHKGLFSNYILVENNNDKKEKIKMSKKDIENFKIPYFQINK